MAYATDEQAIIDKVEAGVPKIANGPFSPAQVGNLEDSGFPVKQDMAKAQELIASYKAENPGPLNISLSTTQDATNLVIAQAQQEFFKQAGFDDVQISQIEQAKYILTALQGNFQAFQWRNHGGYDMDSQLIWWDSSNALPVGRARDQLRPHQGSGDRQGARRQPRRNRSGGEEGARGDGQQAVRDAVLQPLGLLDGVGHPAHAEGEGRGRVHAPERRPSQPGHRRNVRRAVGLDRPATRADVDEEEGDGMRYVRQKLIQLVIVVFAVTFLTFIAINLLPGDPAIFKAGPGATDAQVEQVRHDLGLDKPIPVQYGIWLKKMVTLDFGVSLGLQHPGERADTATALPVTLVVLLYAEILSLIIAIPLGVFSAYRAGTTFDRASSTVAFGLLSVPSYIIGVVLAVLLRGQVGVVPGHLQRRQPLRQPRRALQGLRPPGHHVGRCPDRDLHEAAAHRHARDAPDGLHHHGPREGHVHSAHPVPPRVPAVALLVDHGGGGQRRRPHRRCGHRRADLRPQRHGPAHGRGHRPARLPGGAGLRDDLRRRRSCFINFFVDIAYAFIDPRIRHARALA